MLRCFIEYTCIANRGRSLRSTAHVFSKYFPYLPHKGKKHHNYDLKVEIMT